MAGVPEVGAHKALPVPELGGDLAGAHDGGVGAEDGVGPAAGLQLGEGLALDLHVLEHGLDRCVSETETRLSVDAGELILGTTADLTGDDTRTLAAAGRTIDTKMNGFVPVSYTHLDVYKRQSR